MPTPLQSPKPPWTVLKVLQWTTDYFADRAVESPRAGAEILLAHVLGLRRIDLYLRFDQPLQAGELARFKTAVRRRVQREPVAYITGETEFWSLAMEVSPAVLIPRPETECLVEAALARIPEHSALSVFEPGTGSAAICLAIASERPGCRMAASDVSTAAIGVARRNRQRHGLEARVDLFAGSWFDALHRQRSAFDGVVTNPPYIPAGDIPTLQPEVARFEPRGALDGGPDGLSAIETLLREAYRFLTPNGFLLTEIGYDQADAVTAIARGIGRYSDIQVGKDYSGLDRVVGMRRRG